MPNLTANQYAAAIADCDYLVDFNRRMVRACLHTLVALRTLATGSKSEPVRGYMPEFRYEQELTSNLREALRVYRCARARLRILLKAPEYATYRTVKLAA